MLAAARLLEVASCFFVRFKVLWWCACGVSLAALAVATFAKDAIFASVISFCGVANLKTFCSWRALGVGGGSSSAALLVEEVLERVAGSTIISISNATRRGVGNTN